MLILTRSISESICIINHDGTLSVLKIMGVRGNQVRIGIDAPQSVTIYREEIFNRILYENDGCIPGTQFKEKLYQGESII